jgi:hypothetical protein
MPGTRNNLVASKLESLQPSHAPQNIGALIRHDFQPPEIPRGMKRFYKSAFMGNLLRFFTWWLMISGIYASSSVCPFCGQMGCPVGAASAGIVGGFFALVVGKGKAVYKLIFGWLFHLRSLIKPLPGDRP